MGFLRTNAEELRIGLFIKIEGSWFSHPFPTNTFKIKSPKDLETLRGLKKVVILYDPDKSDAAEDEQDGADDARDAGHTENHSGAKVDEEIGAEEKVQQKIALQQDYQNYQQQLRKVEAEYKGVLREGKTMMLDLTSGSEQGLRTAKKMIGSLNDILVDDDASRALMNLMGDHEIGDEFLMHALNVCALSILIARDLELHRHEIEKIAMGAMLHDIGELKYPREVLLKKNASSSAHPMLKKHPRLGKDALARFPHFPHEAMDIVSQHHERLNGSGYPHGLKVNAITKFAQIVMVADAYDELCNHPDLMQRPMPSEVLSILYTKERDTLWSGAVVSLIRQLGVYPPGSIVRLSDDSVGLVTSVNMSSRLTPIVMVYSQDIPPDEAIIVDLSRENDLCIKEAIRPRELPPDARDYLNPRRIISYYPSVPEAVPEPAAA